jgi:hypothetical protein
MEEFVIFGLSVALSLAAWGIVCATYVWPWVRGRPFAEAVRPLLVLHLFRFVGASFLIPGVAGSTLSRDFALPGAYGDVLAVLLAWVALALLRHAAGTVALWVFNVWGSLDLLFAFYKGAFGPGFHPSDLGATFYIPTLYVPLLLCVHVMIFVLLLKPSTQGSRSRAPSATAAIG